MTEVKSCIYSRVSTSEQDTQNQTMVLTDWAKQRDFEIAKAYEEEESAWKTGHQRALAQLLNDARRGKFTVVLVWSLDRLSREGGLAILTLAHRLAAYGVRVISYQESWTEAPGELGELLYALTGWVARMESQRRSERTKAGLTKAIAHGKKLGRPNGAKDKRRRKKRSPRFATLSGINI